MEIGEPQRTIEVEPLIQPQHLPEPVQEPQPATIPIEEPVHVR